VKPKTADISDNGGFPVHVINMEKKLDATIAKKWINISTA